MNRPYVYVWDEKFPRIVALAAVASDGLWISTPMQDGPLRYKVGRTYESAITGIVIRHDNAGTWLRGDEKLSANVVNFADVQVGEKLIRADWDEQIEFLESVTVIGVGEGAVVTTCPRSPRGILFREANGAWLPADWRLDPAGRCAILAPLSLPDLE